MYCSIIQNTLKNDTMKKVDAIDILSLLPKDKTLTAEINVNSKMNWKLFGTVKECIAELEYHSLGGNEIQVELFCEQFDTRPSIKTWELFVWFFDLLRMEQNYKKVSHFKDADGFIEFVGELRKNKDVCDIRIFNFNE